MNFKRDREKLLSWYQENRRDLPWRANQDPYRIWISEVMLQQTTVAAVIPYYERFMKEFSTLERLAQAPLEKVLELWAGLGYYSRARLLHRSAQALVAGGGFPKSYKELLELPGFGPYTSRAVSSIAFGENVGIVDGNVIRVLSRRYGLGVDWWSPKGRDEIQQKADALVQTQITGKSKSGDLNQALMDLGATICTPKSPKCFMCPWVKDCVARIEGRIEALPKSRPRKEKEIWEWVAQVPVRGGKFGLIENDYAPFLKGHWIWPGVVRKKKDVPKKFSFRHAITCHNIFVFVQRFDPAEFRNKKLRWVGRDELAQVAPSSMVRKAIDFLAH